jgi:hypothetical protein
MKLRDTLSLVGSLVAVGTLGFIAGWQWPKKPPPIVITGAPLQAEAALESSKDEQTAEIDQEEPIDATAGVSKGPIVASKSGSKYHPAENCNFVGRIKPENLVYFQNEAEAQAAGYEPSTCFKK